MRVLTTALNRILAWERRPVPSLLLRILVVVVVLRPWAFHIEPVDFKAADLDPVLLDIAREAGIDILSPAGWPTVSGTLLRTFVGGMAFAIAWWGLAWLRRRLTARFGPGAVGFLGLVLGYMLIQFGVFRLLAPAFPVSPYFATTIPVWSGWLSHPYLGSGGFMTVLSLLAFLGGLGWETLLMAAEGKALLAEARDSALRARLSPHFLFNTLNTLSAQIETDSRLALDTTQRLGGLFEQVLQVTDRPTVSLRAELAMVEDYLGLERRRLGDRMRVEIDVPEELLDREIPVLSLQLLVENALKHAIAPRIEGGTVRIQVSREGKALRLTVEDSGDGTSRGGNGTGQALANLRARLRRPGDLRLERTASGFRASLVWI